MITFISLFSGIGGFDLALERAGMICKAQVELDDNASDVLVNHWPNVKRFKDVRNVGKHNLSTVDLICGGFPCQDVSVAGRRAGLAGERSGLWFEFLRVITELTPRWVVIENVPGLLSSNSGRDFAVILQGLVKCGYGVCWRVLDAQYAGVPQRRRRVFVVAGLTAAGANPAEILFESENSAGDFEPGRKARKSTSGDSGQSAESYRFQRSDTYIRDDKTGALAARDFKSAKDLIVGTLGAEMGRNRGLGQENEASFLVPVAIDVRNLRSNGEVSGTLQSKSTGGYSLNYTNPIALVGNGYYAEGLGTLRATGGDCGGGSEMLVGINAGNGSDISPALTNLAKGVSEDGNGRHAFSLDRYGVRRLTPTECERLQGFPDNWTSGQSDSARYKQLGNAVAVPVVEGIGNRIMQAEWKALWTGKSETVKKAAS